MLNSQKDMALVPIGISHVLPSGKGDLERFEKLVQARKPFTFIRFSDGEIEILRNRKLIIAAGVTEFRGKIYSNQFPEFDQKRFEPKQSQDFRRDLLASATFCESGYFKGIPTKHNNALNDRDFMLRLNGGFSPQMTFSDLFLNSNFLHARSTILPLIVSSFEDLYVVGNWRCILQGYLHKGELVEIPDDFFSSYKQTLDFVYSKLKDAPKSSLILSSASSLSNIIGYRLRISRPDLTFIDIGTVLNDMLGLPLSTRAYHKLMNPKSVQEKIHTLRHKMSSKYKLMW